MLLCKSDKRNQKGNKLRGREVKILLLDKLLVSVAKRENPIPSIIIFIGPRVVKQLKTGKTGGN